MGGGGREKCKEAWRPKDRDTEGHRKRKGETDGEMRAERAGWRPGQGARGWGAQR